MERDEVTIIIARELRKRAYPTPSFIVQEEAEPDTIGHGGYPFHVTFTNGKRFTILERQSDTDETIEAKIIRQLALIFPEASPER
jgi:hypothetical protein